MGWIAVVHRGEGVSKRLARWLAVLAVALVAAALARVVPGRFGYWLDLGLVMFALYLVRLRDRIMAARLGGVAQHAGILMTGQSALHPAQIATPVASCGGRECSKTCARCHECSANMLKKRVLFVVRRIPLRPKTRYQRGREQRSSAEFARQPSSRDRNSRSRCWKQYAGRSRFCARSKSCTSWVLWSASRSSGSRATCSTTCCAASTPTRCSKPSRAPSRARSRWPRCSWRRAISP